VAPEALSGEMVTAAADQYSLATIAFFLLSGCHPYSGKSPREMFTQLLSQPPQPLGKAKEGVLVSPAVEAVVMRGLAKSPKDRYPDVRTFARELRGALGAAGVVAAAPEEAAGLFGKLKGLFRR
jgi:serine/threonine-protein kinase